VAKFFRFEFTFCPDCKDCKDLRVTQITKKTVVDNDSRSIKLERECANSLCPGRKLGHRTKLHKCLTNFIPVAFPRQEIELSDEELRLRDDFVSNIDVKEGVKILSERDSKRKGSRPTDVSDRKKARL